MLTNKSYKQYSYVSRYSSFPYYYDTNTNKYVYGITCYLDENTPYTLHIVDVAETFDNLALKYYGNPTYYWIICSFNHIQNPYKKLVVGEKIKIPSLSTIKFDKTGRS